MRLSLRWDFRRWLILWFTVGSVIRLWQLDMAPRWYDETFTAWVSALPFAQMWEATAGDVHPPLFYAVTWLVAHVAGDSPGLLRLPSLAFSLASLALVPVIGKRLGLTDRARLAATAFMALSTFQVYYAQEARMYSLFELEAMLAALAVLDRRWWLLAVSSAAMMWTHNYGLVIAPLAYGMAGLREMRLPVLPSNQEDPHANFRPLVISGLFVCLVYIPWLPNMLAQISAVGDWWQQPTTPGAFLEPFMVFWFHNALIGNLEPLSQIVISAVTAFSVYKAIRLRSGMTWLVAVALAPMLISWASEVVLHPTYLPRTFIVCSWAIYLLVAWALDSLRLRVIPYAVLGSLFAVAAVYYAGSNAAIKGAALNFIGDVDLAPGDVVYHMNSGSLVSFREKHPTEPEWWENIHPAMPGDMGTLSSRTLKALDVKECQLSEMEWKRAWLIWSAGPTLGEAEDARVMELTGQYQSANVVRVGLWYSDLYRGEVWLLTH